jgi:murein DD-endopeptidase MepM/ murein hydrolase activator NlpD
MSRTGHRQSRARRLAGWAAVSVLVLSLTARADEQTYVVQRSDTLYGIARRYGLSTSQLADRNGLTRDAHIYAGQHLIVPVKPTAATPARPTALASVQKAIDDAPVAPGRWRYVVIHHSGVDQGDLKSIDRYHKEERHMEHGLAYHFLIGNGHGMRDGEIAVGERWREQLDGGHLHSEAQNKIAIGICLIGNFDDHKPTDRQMQSLTALTEAVLRRCKLSRSAVKTHQQINVVRTRCPGRNFPARSFVRGLRSSR